MEFGFNGCCEDKADANVSTTGTGRSLEYTDISVGVNAPANTTL
jgi:hypothetical protein